MKKFVLGMAAAMFGISAVSQSVAQVNPQNNVRYDKRNQNKDSQPIQSQKQITKQVKNDTSKSYARRSFRNYGIPPKVYGMYYVKRGTHKRTNV